MVEQSQQKHPPILLFFKMCALGAVYFIAAWGGLKVGAVNTFATLIWAPTGISLAALLLFGTRLWPGIYVAAFLVNWLTGAPLIVALAIAVGNTLEAVVGAYLLGRVKFNRSLERLRDVLALIVIGGIASTLISTVIGVSSLYFNGMVQGKDIFTTFNAWWLGDMLGDLLIAPFLLVWTRQAIFTKVPFIRALEIFLLMAFAVAGSSFIFNESAHFDQRTYFHPYLIFPIFMAVAVRLNQRWTVTAIVSIAALAIWTTTMNSGPFWNGFLSDSLLRAQIFLGILAATKMVLAAAVMERKAREEEAYESVRARDEFLSIASHELKTPLTSLSLRLQLATSEVQKIQTETGAFTKITIDLMTGCSDQLKRMTVLIDELLDLTRIRAGKMLLEKKPANLSLMVNGVAERFRSELGTNAALIHVQENCEAPGNWDQVRIEQVIGNLLSNAIKYGDGKPVYVSIETDKAKAKVRLSVKDQGIGIAPEMSQKIFERFERAGIGNQISGLGLGLYICRQIVEAHGGRIWVESDGTRGSIFKVELPEA